MSGIALKLSSLVIRTLAKPISNAIKRQAREHEGFRRICISFAQSLHRVDMRLRLGLLRDTAAIEKQAARDEAEAAAKKHKYSVPTVKTKEQTEAEEMIAAKIAKNKAKAAEPTRTPPKPRIRPLSEAKAIESGASFISEAFLFGVAGGLIFFESWRSRRKESTRREDVADRLADLEESEKAARRALVELEREVLRLRAKEEKGGRMPVKRILPREIWVVEENEEKEDEQKAQGWLSRIVTYMSTRKGPNEEASQALLAKHSPGPAERIFTDSDAVLASKHKAVEEGKVSQEANSKSSSETNDLKLPLRQNGVETSLIVLLIEPSQVLEDLRPHTIARIQCFARQTNDNHRLILLIQNNGLEGSGHGAIHAFMDLQVILLNVDPSPAIIPVAGIDSILPGLESFVDSFEYRPAPQVEANSFIPTALISHATATAPDQPLCEHTANVLSDLFPSIKAIEEATRSEQGKAKLRDFLGERTAQQIMDFWEDEWMP